MKAKRVWTDAQRQAAADRCRKMAEKRRAEKYMVDVAPVEKTFMPEMESAVAVKERPAEVQAVLDTMSPERKAKLEMIQARNLATLSQTKEGQEALARLEQRHHPTVVMEGKTPEPQPMAETPKEIREASNLPPSQPMVREIPMKAPFRLTGSQSGLMISELGNCICGEPKLKWHPICLKVRI